jgi:ABC-type transport system involved in cytochrome c biogenesis ATPase subunit
MLPPANIEVRFFVPETVVGGLKPGQSISVHCDGCQNSAPSAITYISNQAEYTPPVIYSNENRSKLAFMIIAKPASENAALLHPGSTYSGHSAMTTAANSEYAIDVRDLNKSFGDKHVVNNVSLRVRKGEIFGFLGPNGSGKTTTIRLMCGLLKPDSGSGTCLGYDILRQSGDIKRDVGYMTQRFSFWEDLTIAENLDFVARMYNVPDRQAVVRHTIADLGLTSRSKQLAGELSGGWKQRMALAACMLHNPGCCFWMSQLRASILKRGAISGTNSRVLPPAVSRCSSVLTTWMRPLAATSSHTSHMENYSPKVAQPKS